MPAAKPAFKLTNATFPLFVLHLQHTDYDALSAQLETQVAEVPEFFVDKPVVLSLAPLAEADAPVDWDRLCDLLRQLGMRVAGVMDASPAQRSGAHAAGLGLLPDRVARKTVDPVAEVGEVAVSETVDAPAVQSELPLAATVVPEAPSAVPPSPTFTSTRRPAMVIDKPVRTGQRIHADGTDLIVLAVVSAGAELIADGDIHVYAPLRGRALAGARGNVNARIFTQSMEAELVSVAGNFKVLEDVPAALKGKPAQVFLDQDKVVMQPLGAVRVV